MQREAPNPLFLWEPRATAVGPARSLPCLLLAYVAVVSHTPRSLLRQFLQNQRLFRSAVHVWHTTFRSLSARGVSACPQRLPAAMPAPLPWVPPQARPCAEAPCACCPRAGFADHTPKNPPRSHLAGSEPRLSPRGEVSATPLSAVPAAAPHLAAQRRRSGSGAEPSGPPAARFGPLQPSSARFEPVQPGPARPGPGPAPGRCRASPPEEPPPSQPARRRRAPQPAP